jgi:hypothetical protein
VLRIPEAQRPEALTVATALALIGGTAGWVLSGTLAQKAGLTPAFWGLAALQLTAAALFVFGALGTASPPPAPPSSTDPAEVTRTDPAKDSR